MREERTQVLNLINGISNLRPEPFVERITQSLALTPMAVVARASFDAATFLPLKWLAKSFTV